jgi:hypothetical protein
MDFRFWIADFGFWIFLVDPENREQKGIKYLVFFSNHEFLTLHRIPCTLYLPVF